MIIRIFDTAMAPEDIDAAKEIFRSQVRPVWEAFDGCLGIDLYIGIDEHSRDLVDVAAISRWSSMDAIAEAIKTEGYERSLTDLRRLFQQTPIVRHFESAE